MVVKSATKKRLMDLGLAEDLCHKLANDRKIGEVRKMNISQLELLTESQYSAIATKLRIAFDQVIHEFFYAGSKYGLGGRVAVANPRSSLEYRESSNSVKNCIINWWSDHILGSSHDFDMVMAKFRQKFPRGWVEVVGQVNDDWYPKYYEDWVDRNSNPYNSGVFDK